MDTLEIPEILSKIIGFLNEKDITQARLVNSFWCKQSFSSFRRLSTIRLTPRSQKFLTYLRKCPDNLPENFDIEFGKTFCLPLDNENLFETVIFLFERNAENIKSLRLKAFQCQIDECRKDEGTNIFQCIRTVLEMLPNLKKLELNFDIRDVNWNKSQFQIFPGIGLELASLKDLKLSLNYYIYSCVLNQRHKYEAEMISWTTQLIQLAPNKTSLSFGDRCKWDETYKIIMNILFQQPILFKNLKKLKLPMIEYEANSNPLMQFVILTKVLKLPGCKNLEKVKEILMAKEEN